MGAHSTPILEKTLTRKLVHKDLMMLKLFFVFLTSVASLPHSLNNLPKDITCPPGNDPNNMYFPNPEDCYSFYQCVWGVPHLINCPDGLMFDPSLNVCNRNVNCEQPTAAPTRPSRPTYPDDRTRPSRPTPEPTEEPDSDEEGCSSEEDTSRVHCIVSSEEEGSRSEEDGSGSHEEIYGSQEEEGSGAFEVFM